MTNYQCQRRRSGLAALPAPGLAAPLRRFDEHFLKEQIGATVEVAKRNELHTFAVIPKRWVVERSFSWLE